MKAASPLLLAGCTAAAGLADPPLAQLARWRTAAREAIAAESVVAPCPAANPACPRLHALRAEACLAEALATRAPGAACPASRSTPLLACAAEGYSADTAFAAVRRHLHFARKARVPGLIRAISFRCSSLVFAAVRPHN